MTAADRGSTNQAPSTGCALVRPVWVHPGDVHFSQDQCHLPILHPIAVQWSVDRKGIIQQNKYPPDDADQAASDSGVGEGDRARGNSERSAIEHRMFFILLD